LNSIIYGPVSSWRLGRSLGLDLICTDFKSCSFDCLYCQLGRTIYPLKERKEFVSLTNLQKELELVKDVACDYLTFSGMGEPTLAQNLGPAIKLAKSIIHLPVAVLTNSSLLAQEDVCRDLALADVVVAKVDAPNEELFSKINRPIVHYCHREILEGIRLFRQEFDGKLALQMMFIEANKDYAPQMAKIAAEVSPDEVQLNTPLRPCAQKPLTPQEMAVIKQEFIGLKAISVYEESSPQILPLNVEQTLKRRPKL
jgi:wyosine [tRNA(Phe)-imidazoG37] synthetase (radical SAM superfamily)